MITVLLLLSALVLLAAVVQVLRLARRTLPAPQPAASPIRTRVWRVYRGGRLIYETTEHDSGMPTHRSAP